MLTAPDASLGSLLFVVILESGLGMGLSSLYHGNARARIGAPDLASDLSGLQASWGGVPMASVLRCAGVFSVTGAILLALTWMPLLSSPLTAFSLSLSAGFTLLWGLTFLFQATNRRSMWRQVVSIQLETTAAHLSVTLQRPGGSSQHQLTLSGLRVEEDGIILKLRPKGAAELLLPCQPGPSRQDLIAALEAQA